MRHAEILFSVAGQSFTYDPPEMFQPSGTPTVQVFGAQSSDDATAESATTGACSVDSVATTFSASRGDQSITVASGTGIAKGRRYLVTDTDGDCEWIEVVSITGTTVGLRRPLSNSYAATSTLKGTRISISVDSTWVADSSNITEDDAGHAGYRLRWAYTVNGSATIGVSFADLVRYSAKNLVSAPDVDARFPGWIDRLGPDYWYDQGAALIAEAYQAVRMDAMGDGQIARSIRNTEILRELTIHKANLIAIENQVISSGNNITGLEAARALYAERFNRLVREPRFPVDHDGDGASQQAERLPAWRR